MSLRLIHIFFILAADTLCAFFGVWSMKRGDSRTAIASFAVCFLLGIYLVRFIRKSKGMS